MKVSRHVVMSRLLIIVNRMCKREAKKSETIGFKAAFYLIEKYSKIGYIVK